MKILLWCIVLSFLFVVFFPENNVFAVTSVLWDTGNGGSHSIYDGTINSFTVTQFTVTDLNLAGNGITDKINVQVNSTSDPVGITLTLTEMGDAGSFTNTNLIFTNGTGLVDISSSQTVGLIKPYLNTDPNVVESIISSPLTFEGLQIFSTTDTSGIFMNSTETGSNTGIFTNTLHFTTGPSIDGYSISVHPGDIVSIQDRNNLDSTNEIVTPNPDPALGVLTARYGDEVDVSYDGITESVFLIAGSSPGGGGGGLIRPGLVLDILNAVGGSPYVVSPPSFGGSHYHYSDGLTITQGTKKITFDTSLYNQKIPEQVMVSGQQVNMTFKTFESYNPAGMIHMGLYIIPRGEDMLTTNSIGSIMWEKEKPVEVNDPNHLLSNVTATSDTDAKFQYTKFTFVPTKSYDKMSFLVRAWNDHLYSTDIRVHDDVTTPPPLYSQPYWLHVYTNSHEADLAVEGAGFEKPNIFSHVSTSDQVWNQNGGTVSWFYDEKDQAVAMESFDSNQNLVWSKTELLHKQTPQIKQGPDASYAGNHLDRWNKSALENAQKEEQKRVDTTLQMMGYPVYWNHSIIGAR